MKRAKIAIGAFGASFAASEVTVSLMTGWSIHAVALVVVGIALVAASIAHLAGRKG